MDRDGFSKVLKDRKWHRAGDRVVQALHDLRPWKDGNPALRVLHDLWNQDKHRLFLPVLHAVEVKKLRAGTGQLSNVTFSGSFKLGPIMSQGVPMSVDASSIGVVFGMGTAFPVQDVVETLRRVSAEVRRAFDLPVAASRSA